MSLLPTVQKIRTPGSQNIGKLKTYIHPKNKENINIENLTRTKTIKTTFIFSDINLNKNILNNLSDNIRNNITTLTFLKTNLKELPENLPPNLTCLKCTDNKITKLPELPSSLVELNCSYNKITEFINLPPNLEKLDCSYNQITEFINLPTNLQKLICKNNIITKLELPPNLVELNCSYNKITEFINLPINLKKLDCSYNQITKLELPIYIEKLNISFNTKLEELVIPDNIKLELTLDSYQLKKFKDFLVEKKFRYLKLIIYHLDYEKFDKNLLKDFHYNIYYINKLPNNYKKKIIENYNIVIKRIEGGSQKKQVKKNKNSKINLKKSELQKIASKNSISLKKNDGTMKKKIELYKSLKIKKLI